MPVINNYLYSRKTSSDIIGYDNYYQTFFYNIYSKYDEKNGIEVFYMASEDKESLLARLVFYKKYISSIEYPIIDKKGHPDYVAGNSFLAMLYVLSLPEECFKTKNKDELLSAETAIERINFVDSLNSQKDNEPTNDYFLSDKYYQKLTNHLISRGFYFLNIEALSTSSSQIPFEHSPFIIDEEKFFNKYDIATADRIYLSFSKISLVTPEDYVEFYKKIDAFSMQEQIEYAFDINEAENDIEYCVKVGLIEYYFAILRKEAREYFDLHLNSNTNKVKRSVLDYECGNHFLKYNYFAYGTHFSLIATDSRKFMSKKGVITEYIKPTIFKLLPQDITKLLFTYKTVKQYLDLHQEYKYMPHLFIKLMGLPFEALNLVKNFNFKDGNPEDFLKLIPIYESNEYFKYKLADLDGYIVEFDEDKINYILNKLCSNNLYIMNYDEDVFFDSNIIMGKTNNSGFYKFLASLNRVSKESKSFLYINNFRKKLLQSNCNNKNKIKKTYNLAIEIVNYYDDDKMDEFQYSNSTYYDQYDELIEMIFDINLPNSNLSKTSFISKEDISYCEFLPLPYIHIGNNFIGYSSKENGDIYFDSNQIDSIKIFMEIINYYFANNIKYYYFYRTVKDRCFLDMIRLKENAQVILGLPSSLNSSVVLSQEKNKIYNIEKTISNLKIKKCISIESNGLSKTFINDSKISYLLIFSDIITKHKIIPYFFLSKTRNKSFFVPYLKLPNNKFSLDDQLEQNYYYFGLSNLQPHYFDYKVDLLPTTYNKDFNQLFENKDYCKLFNLPDNQQSSILLHYLSSLELYYLYSSFESLFRKTSFYQIESPISLRSKKVYVLHGSIFNAYSFDNKNYFFDLEDKDLIYNAYLLNNKLSNEVSFTDPVIDKLSFGIPHILTSNIISSVLNKKVLSKDEFESLFSFKKRPDIDNNSVFDSIFSKKPNLKSIHDISSIVKYNAIKQGLYIWEATYNKIDCILDFEDTSIDYNEFLNEINQIYSVYIDKNISEDVETYLKPKKTLFFALLQEFTKGVSSLNRVDIQKVLKLKYHIELLYDEDPNFIYKLVNKIYSKDNQKLFDYLEKHTTFLNSSRLDLPYKIKKHEHFNYLIAFIIYVIHCLIKTLCKYQNN